MVLLTVQRQEFGEADRKKTVSCTQGSFFAFFSPFIIFVLTFSSLVFLLPNDTMAADSLLDWSTRPATNMETGGTDAAVVDGITVTTSGTIVGGRTSDTLTIAPGTTLNGYSGVISSALNATIDDESVYNQIDFAFSEPVYNLRFRVIDVDGISGGSFFSDLIVFGSSAGVPSSATTGANITYTLGTGRALENSASNCTGDDPLCQVNIVYDGPITSASVQHVAADVAGTTNPTNQAIQIFDLTFNTAPDATNNIASTFPGGSAPGNVISDNDGFGTDSDLQDGSSVVVNQISHPDGTLAVGGGGAVLNLLNGASLTIAQDGSYTFNTNGAYAGLAPGSSTTETFTYRIEDQEGLFNTNGDVPNPDSLATLVVTITNNPVPSFTLTKTVDQASIAAPGTLTYTITVANTGNVDLTGISLSDILSQGGSPLTMTTGPTLTSGDTDVDNEVDVGETWVYTATYSVIQANVDDGDDILNIAIFDTAETASQNDSASTTTPGPTFACAGDNFPGNAISGASGTTTCFTTGATGETGEPNPTGGAVESIWYTWTAPLTGTVEFNTCDVATTDYDTTLGAYTGATVGALATIIENDDGTGCANFSSRLSFAATSGTTYRIRVDGYQGNDGNFKLDWLMTAPEATITKSVNQSNITSQQTLTYTIIVDNSGTVDLTGPGLADQLLQNGAAQTLTSGPTLTAGDINGNGIMETTETWIYSATYDVTLANMDDANDLDNTATFSSNEAATVADSATTSITPAPSLSVSKIATFDIGAGVVTADGVTDNVPASAVVTYTYIVTNDGNQTISNVSLSDLHGGSGTTPAPDADSALLTDNGPAGDSTNPNGGDNDWDALAPGDVLTVTAPYIVTQNDIETLQ